MRYWREYQILFITLVSLSSIATECPTQRSHNPTKRFQLRPIKRDLKYPFWDLSSLFAILYRDMKKESEEGGSLIHIIVHKLFMLMIYSSYLIRSQKRSGDRCIPSQNHTRLSLVLWGHRFFKLHVAHQSICYDKQGENKWHVIKHRYSSLFCLFDCRWISIYQFRFHCLSQSESTNQNHLEIWTL